MAVSIGNRNPTERATPCVLCGTLVFVGECFADGVLCNPCGVYSLYSDLYKEENGFRPHNKGKVTVQQMEAWIADYDQRHNG